jgi:hypothetical protein
MVAATKSCRASSKERVDGVLSKSLDPDGPMGKSWFSPSSGGELKSGGLELLKRRLGPFPFLCEGGCGRVLLGVEGAMRANAGRWSSVGGLGAVWIALTSGISLCGKVGCDVFSG